MRWGNPWNDHNKGQNDTSVKLRRKDKFWGRSHIWDHSLDSRDFSPFHQTVKGLWNSLANSGMESQRINPSDHETDPQRFFSNRDLSSRRGTKQAAAWDQGRNLAISTFQFLKPLYFVMCLGWESGQAGKWSDVKLKILDFPSTWCWQLIHPKTVIQGTGRGVSQFGTQIANSGASKIRRMTLF